MCSNAVDVTERRFKVLSQIGWIAQFARCQKTLPVRNNLEHDDDPCAHQSAEPEQNQANFGTPVALPYPLDGARQIQTNRQRDTKSRRVVMGEQAESHQHPGKKM